MKKQVTNVPNYRKPFEGLLRFVFIIALLLQVMGMVRAQTPTITSFIPNAGPVGTLVTITGTSLGSPTAFTIGGTAAIVVSNSGTTLVGIVMPGATTGSISVTTGGETATAAGSFTVTATPYPSVQQGDKLVGTGTVGAAGLGYSVAVSADGNTAIVGGYSDNSSQGAAWIYTRSGNTWSQQEKIVGTGNTGAARQGSSVAVSADGNTAIIGGSSDNSDFGATWVFTRSGSTWTQQGIKLVGNGSTGVASQGYSAALSADGKTVIVGGINDNTFMGAAWVFGTSTVTWTGAVSSDWNTAGNWSNNAVPETTFDMTIANTANSPVISQGPGAPAECHNLSINSGAVLTIGAGKALTVNGDIISYAGTSGLVIQSDATGTGSLLHKTVGAPATVKRYITGSATLTEYKYHLVSVPLEPASASTANLFLGSYLYDFNVATNAWNSLGTSTNTVLDETKGYMLYYPAASTTYSFGGNMNAGAFTPTVINAGSGFNLVPNPYPSVIDWDAATGWTKTSIGGSTWIWSAANGNYAAYNSISGGTNGGTKYITAGQAFFVQATAAAPALAMNNPVRLHNSQAFWKSETNLPDRLSIKVESNDYSDEAVVRFDDNATPQADPKFDAAKMPGLDNAPQRYTMTPANEQLSINSLPHSAVALSVPLNFELKADKTATLTISGIESFSPNANISLEDKLVNTTINMRKQATYTFTHQQGNAADRFVLHFNGATGVEDLPVANGRIWVNDHTVNIAAPASI